MPDPVTESSWAVIEAMDELGVNEPDSLERWPEIAKRAWEIVREREVRQSGSERQPLERIWRGSPGPRPLRGVRSGVSRSSSR
jgi:hypothetical protein